MSLALSLDVFPMDRPWNLPSPHLFDSLHSPIHFDSCKVDTLPAFPFLSKLFHDSLEDQCLVYKEIELEMGSSEKEMEEGEGGNLECFDGKEEDGKREKTILLDVYVRNDKLEVLESEDVNDMRIFESVFDDKKPELEGVDIVYTECSEQNEDIVQTAFNDGDFVREISKFDRLDEAIETLGMTSEEKFEFFTKKNMRDLRVLGKKANVPVSDTTKGELIKRLMEPGKYQKGLSRSSTGARKKRVRVRKSKFVEESE